MPRHMVISRPKATFDAFGDGSEATVAASRAAREPAARGSGRRTTWLMLALAAALLLAGLGGIVFDQALRAALRAPTAADEASAVCTYLRSQDYSALAGEMDPSPDETGPSTFDPAAFMAQLRALDRSEGVVQSCALRQLGPTGNAYTVVFALTIRRSRMAIPLGSLVVVRATSPGTWMIGRTSTFYYAAS